MNQEQLTDLIHLTYWPALMWARGILAGVQHVLKHLYHQGVPLAGCGDLCDVLRDMITAQKRT